MEKYRQSNQNIPVELIRKTKEHWGVAIAAHKRFVGLIEEINATNSRLMHLKLNSNSNVHLIAAYAPTSDANVIDKERFYEKMDELIESVPAEEFLAIAGNFNAKLMYLDEEEEGQLVHLI